MFCLHCNVDHYGVVNDFGAPKIDLDIPVKNAILQWQQSMVPIFLFFHSKYYILAFTTSCVKKDKRDKQSFPFRACFCTYKSMYCCWVVDLRKQCCAVIQDFDWARGQQDYYIALLSLAFKVPFIRLIFIHIQRRMEEVKWQGYLCNNHIIEITYLLARKGISQITINATSLRI